MAPVTDLRTRLGAAGLERDVVRVQGPEALEYLQGQLSQDVVALADGASAWALLLQPSGKVDAWLRVTRVADDDLLLDVDVGHGEAVEARLRRFRLRTKADIERAKWRGFAVRGPGASQVAPPAGARALRAPWPGVEGVDLLSETRVDHPGVPTASADALEALRIECGVPAMGAELTDDTIPAEAGRWLIEESVSFTKGCYTGQELVARIDSRGGNVPKPVRGLVLEADGAAPGDEVTAAGNVVGHVTSLARSAQLGPVALAPVNRKVGPGAAVEVRGAGGAVAGRVAELPLR